MNSPEPSPEPSGIPPILAEETPRSNPARWRWIIHLAVIGGYPLLVGLLGWGRTAAPGPVLGDNASDLLRICAVELVSFGILLGIALAFSRPSPDQMLLRWRKGFWPIPLGLGYSVGLRMALGIILAVVAGILVVLRVVSLEQLKEFSLANRPDVEALVDVSALRDNPAYFWLTLTLVSFVVAGLREELWRAAFLAGMAGAWPSSFGSRAGQIVAVVIAAVIFGIGHVTQGAIAIIPTALLGLGLGLIMVFHRSIWPAVIAHGMFDATSLAVLPWALEQFQNIQKP